MAHSSSDPDVKKWAGKVGVGSGPVPIQRMTHWSNYTTRQAEQAESRPRGKVLRPTRGGGKNSSNGG